MGKRFRKELAAHGIRLTYPATQSKADDAVVTEADLANLPEPAQRYLRFMQVIGKPRDWSFSLNTEVKFRIGPDLEFQPSRVTQYNSRLDVARLFQMRHRVKALPVSVHDTYVNGRGHMQAKLLGLIPVVDESGEKLDIGELVTYLNDAVLMAPTFLLAPEVKWEAIDENAFGLSLTDRGTTVRARVVIDDAGAPTDFVTTDRFVTDPENPKGEMIRGEWHTPVSEWQNADGHKIPKNGSAVWHLSFGEFEYAKLLLKPGDIHFNVAPDAV